MGHAGKLGTMMLAGLEECVKKQLGDVDDAFAAIRKAPVNGGTKTILTEGVRIAPVFKRNFK